MRLLPLVLVPFLLAACGSSETPSDSGAVTTDAGDVFQYDAPPRNDKLNLACGGRFGDETAEDCARRLAAEIPGARFFVGPRAPCDADLADPRCAPLCPLSSMSNTNCSFESRPGCSMSFSEGYMVVVEVNGKRWRAAVGDGGNCASTPTGRVQWGRVGYDDLLSGARCANSLPAGGLGPARFGGCEEPMAACGTVRGDACQTLMFMTQMGVRMANVCTRECAADSDCGPNGKCDNDVCFRRCGGECALGCADGFVCQVPMGMTTGTCLPSLSN